MKSITNFSTFRRSAGAALALAVAATLTPAAQAYILVVTNNLTITSGGTLDVEDNALMIMSGTIGTPTAGIYDNVSSPTTGLYNGITGYVQSGFWNNLPATYWGGTGITSSVAANDWNVVGNGFIGVGVVDNAFTGGGSVYGTNSVFGYTTWRGVSTFTETEILLRETYTGDSDLNGVVDSTDYGQIDNGFNAGLTGWINGDFNYDGTVDPSDYGIIDATFNGQGAPLGQAVGGGKVGGVVPEPGSLGLLLLGTLGILGRRARK